MELTLCTIYLFCITYLLYIYPFKRFYLCLFPFLAFIPFFSKSKKNKFKSFWESRRNNKLLPKELVSFIDMLRGSIKAGILPSEAIRFVLSKRNWKSKIKETMSIVAACQKGGMCFADALDAGIANLDNSGMDGFLHLLLSSLKAGQTTGGDLVALLDRLYEKIDGAIRLRRKALVITSQMRLQGLIITFVPLVAGVIMFFLQTDNILFFFNNTLGIMLFALMVTLNIVGALFLKKITTIKGMQ